MKIDVNRFGCIEIDERCVIEMPRGLLGFEGHRRFRVVHLGPGVLFKRLQSVESPELTFIVIDPLQFFEDYEVEVSDSDAELLDMRTPDEALVMTLVTFGEEEVTTNLLGPIVLNARTFVGIQVVLQNDRYGTRQRIGSLDQSQAQARRSVAKAA